MSNVLMGHQISRELLDALGLPKQTRGFTLRCYSHEAVTVECEYYPDGSFQTALKKYALTSRPEQQQPTTFDFNAWMRGRTERAHREFMKRTSCLPRCDGRESLDEKIKRYFGDRQY